MLVAFEFVPIEKNEKQSEGTISEFESLLASIWSRRIGRSFTGLNGPVMKARLFLRAKGDRRGRTINFTSGANGSQAKRPRRDTIGHDIYRLLSFAGNTTRLLDALLIDRLVESP